MYFKLLEQLGPKQKRRIKLKIKVPVYLLDSTLISMPVFVRIGQHIELKKEPKMHTLLEYDGKLPVYVNITKGSVALITRGAKHSFGKGAVIVADRFYNDFPMLSIWDNKGVFFVIRHKRKSEI